jgi:protein O-GlcNAc transferase
MTAQSSQVPISTTMPTNTSTAARLELVRQLWAAKQYDEALEACRQAVVAAPDDPAGYLALADLLCFCGRMDDACAILDTGRQRIPGSFALDWARCVATLPPVYADEGEIDLARTEYTSRLFELRERWRSGRVTVAEAVAALNFGLPCHLPYQSRPDRALQAVYGELVAEIMGAAHPRHTQPVRRAWRPAEPIRVGFVSGCFWRYSVWRLPVRGWVENLDRNRFKLFGYHSRAERDDQTTQAARLFDRFVTGPRSTAEWIAEIEHDAPHVLIYPELGMDSGTLRLAALRLAPVQCTSLGHPVTSGLPTIDYYLSSELMEPPDGQDHYTERLIRLPGIGTAYRPEWAAFGDPLPTGDSWAELRLPQDAVRFVSCQMIAKYLPAYDDVLPRIAAVLPAARFVFVATRAHPTAIFQRRLAAAFARHGLQARVFCHFVVGMSCAKFSALVRDADVFLDTIGWSGFNTTLEARAHGVPVVTLPGRFMRGRHSQGVLTAAGVTETIAASVDDYVALAARLGRDVAWRRRVSERMREGARCVFDDVAPVRGLEEFLVEAVEQASTEPAMMSL